MAGPADGTRVVSTLNIANALTVARIVAVPFFLWALLADDGARETWRWVAAAIFALAIFTDRLDGQLARSRGLITDFGKLADPIADKALIGAALLGLSLLGELSWWVTAVVMTREVGITVLRMWVVRRGVIAANRGGKLKTLVQSVAIGVYLLAPEGYWLLLGQGVMAAAVAITVITGLDYVREALALRRA